MDDDIPELDGTISNRNSIAKDENGQPLPPTVAPDEWSAASGGFFTTTEGNHDPVDPLPKDDDDDRLPPTVSDSILKRIADAMKPDTTKPDHYPDPDLGPDPLTYKRWLPDPDPAPVPVPTPSTRPAGMPSFPDPERAEWYFPFTPDECNAMIRFGSTHLQKSLSAKIDAKIKERPGVEVDKIRAPRRMSTGEFVAGLDSRAFINAAPIRARYSGLRLADIPDLSGDIAFNQVLLYTTGRVSRSISSPFGWHPDTTLYSVPRDRKTNSVDFVRYAWTLYNCADIEGGSDGVWDESPGTVAKAISGTNHQIPTVRSRDTWADAYTAYLDEAEKTVHFVYPTSQAAPQPPVEPEAVPVPPPAKAAKKKERVVTRPNGQKYYPRLVQVGDRTELYDVDMLQRARADKIPVLLFGDPGTGKTALCEASLPGLITLEGNADTEASDFIGSYIQVGQDEFEWRDGPLLRAAEAGGPFLVDEIAMIDPRVLPVLYSSMDGRGTITVSANPARGEVTIKDGFYVVGACNPNVPGAVMSDALLSRFSLQIRMTTDYAMLRRLGVDTDILAVAANLARNVANETLMRAPQTRELLAYQRIKDSFGRGAALSNLISSANVSDRDTYIQTISSSFQIKAASIQI